MVWIIAFGVAAILLLFAWEREEEMEMRAERAEAERDALLDQLPERRVLPSGAQVELWASPELLVRESARWN
jgi:hypothetical protein